MGYLVSYLADRNRELQKGLRREGEPARKEGKISQSLSDCCWDAVKLSRVKSCTLNPLQIDALRGPALGSLLGRSPHGLEMHGSV